MGALPKLLRRDMNDMDLGILQVLSRIRPLVIGPKVRMSDSHQR